MEAIQLGQVISAWWMCFILVEVFQLGEGISARSSVGWLRRREGDG